MMDLITKSQLSIFCKDYSLESHAEDSQFEHYAGFATLRRHYDRTFDPSHIVVGKGGDTGIDALAIVVNNVLVTDVDQVAALGEQNDYIDATFIFVQAERSDSFDGNKIANLTNGIIDFFKDKPLLVRNEKIKAAAEVQAAIYNNIGLFRDRPKCVCYYVTTGKWQDDQNLVARRTVALNDLNALKIFSAVEFHCFGSDEIQKAYNLTRNPISRDFVFKDRADLPPTLGVKQAWLGFIPHSQFKKIVRDESGKEILGSIFDSNVRDWQDYTPVNQDIQKTLKTDAARSRFVLMNNGITIIARRINTANDRFTIEDFQIVNGCQTSHVVFNEPDLDDTVCIPLRLIETRDEEVIRSIIRATNNQSPLKPEQLYALLDFSEKLEEYFQATAYPLYYERRDAQYERLSIPKTRIIVPIDLIRAFVAMFQNEPHRTTRSIKSLRAKVGDEIFLKDHKLAPYYAAALAYYRLEWLFRNNATDFPSEYKPARYHILLAARLLVCGEDVPWLNSGDADKLAAKIVSELAENNYVKLFKSAVDLMKKITGGNFDRDYVRQKPITDALIKHFGLHPKV